MDRKKVEILAADITKQCEQQGFTVEEAQLLPAMVKSAIKHSIEKLKMQSTSSPQDDKEKVYFLCSGKMDGCTREDCFKFGGECHHTSDIRSAINFRKGIAEGQYCEKQHGEEKSPPTQQGDCSIDGLTLNDLP